ncbi:MAG TPA: DUF2007 domain-containing protein [Thermoanaerobaculia bacterium]|nr:DUF2007 domain-containing protein [Thermoanaerobaculia bacterium]
MSDIVKVYACGNPALVPLIESLLNDAGIDFMMKGESVQQLFAAGQFGGMSYAMGPVEFWVREDDRAEAIEILEKLDAVEP